MAAVRRCESMPPLHSSGPPLRARHGEPAPYELRTTTFPTIPHSSNAADITAKLGLVTSINDNPSKFVSFSQLTYTHTTPDNSWSFAVGQYPMFNFDGNAYNWSLNAVQNLSKTWAIFARANTASGAVNPIKSSYALGVAMNDPLKRTATDQIAVAVGYSDVAPPPVNPAGARDEKVVEAYWSWTVFGGLLPTPSAQVTFDPALDPGRAGVLVLSIRATLLF
jgi:Carbohydrate-selective porin, OprB family